MKKIYFSLLLTLVLSILATNAFAYNAYIDGIYYDFNGTNAIVTSGDTPYSGNIVIPKTIEKSGVTYNVTSIGYRAFFRCGDLSSVTIPGSVRTIEGDAFLDCTSLTSITIPDGVTTIGSRAFMSCTGLTMVTIPGSVRTIEGNAFLGCTSLTSITIPDGVTTIGSRAFYGCVNGSNLTSVTVAWETPIELNGTTFANKHKATLYVPKGTGQLYKTAPIWQDFKKIVELEETGLDSIRNGNLKTENVYDLNGRPQTNSSKGINIIRFSDGSTKKVLNK